MGLYNFNERCLLDIIFEIKLLNGNIEKLIQLQEEQNKLIYDGFSKLFKEKKIK